VRPLPPGQDVESHWAGLSFLRFVLSFSVLLSHIDDNLPEFHNWFFGVGGVSCVAGFFLISGFSIAHSITLKPQGYLKRRLLRIYPLSITAVIVGVSLVKLAGGPHYTGMARFETPPTIYVLSELLLINSIVTRVPPVLVTLWSLDCEVIYYVLAPLLRRLNTLVLALLALGSAGFYLWYTPRYGLWFGLYGLPALAMLWVWLLGFIIYRRRLDIGVFALVAISGTYVLWPLEKPPLSALVLGFVVPLLAIAYFGKIAMPARWIPAANYLGEISYPLYLFHFPVISIVYHWFPDHDPYHVGLLIDLTVPMLMAIAAYHLIDVPIRKRRFHPQPL
jgi:peptidoglycan/LPS O-acetylase OafA/YrhL